MIEHDYQIAFENSGYRLWEEMCRDGAEIELDEDGNPIPEPSWMSY